MAAQQQYHHHPLPPPPPAQQVQQGPYHPQDSHHQAGQHQYSPSHQPSQAQYFPQQPHPAPVAQQQSQTQTQPPPKSRTYSFQSSKSRKSSGSQNRADAHESSAEKEANRLHSKADPTMAISEAEPAAVQAMTKSSLAPLRSIQHRDPYGNPIADPDRSNPTRSRWERPLDTIRSFEAAIDGGYSRKSFIRSDTESVANWNRRSSYFGGGGGSTPGPRFPNEGYYGGRPPSTHFDYGHNNRSGYFDQMQYNGGGGGGGGYGGGPSRQRASRLLSEPAHGYGRNEQAVYPMPHKDRSYETVTTAAGSGSSAEQAGYQTDPTSSDNSSIDRTSPAKRAEPVNDYGIGFSQPASYQPAAFNFNNGARAAPATNGGAHPQQAVQSYGANGMGPPPVPQKDSAGGGGGVLRKQSTLQRPGAGEKRKSWFSRRFSKNMS